jgi:hypothetical protein
MSSHLYGARAPDDGELSVLRAPTRIVSEMPLSWKSGQSIEGIVANVSQAPLA